MMSNIIREHNKTIKALRKRINELERSEKQCLNIIEMLTNNMMLCHKYGLDKRLEKLVKEELKKAEVGYEQK